VGLQRAEPTCPEKLDPDGGRHAACVPGRGRDIRRAAGPSRK
jgi:hypothetical protein